MQKAVLLFSTIATAIVLGGCGVEDTRDQVVYPYSPPVPRAEYRSPDYQSSGYRAPAQQAQPVQRRNYSACPGDAEELAPGSICPSTAQCYEISGGKRCIVYEK